MERLRLHCLLAHFAYACSCVGVVRQHLPRLITYHLPAQGVWKHDIFSPSNFLRVQQHHRKVEIDCLLIRDYPFHFSKSVNRVLADFIVPNNYGIEVRSYAFGYERFIVIVGKAIIGCVLLKSKFSARRLDVGSKRKRLIDNDCPRRLLAIHLAVFAKVSREYGTKFIAFLLNHSVLVVRFISDNKLRVNVRITFRPYAFHVLAGGYQNPFLLLLV